MLYHLLYPLHTAFSGFNIFRYITVRSIGGAVTAFLLMIILGPMFIRALRRFQIGQVVRDDGPETHLAKQGVPTMGGVLILSAITCSTLLWARLDSSLVWLLLFVSLFFGMIGAIDDLKKVRKKNSKGLSARGKLILQIGGASVVGLFVLLHPGFDGQLSV
ncbi:MAG: phospho-N-acetylmuramoyl-pentapeptide-transferase, partial [Proteobacteria bacterium]|nr:phospho-N-acetylmuramoyl-pentapeptide-transferase [Pseudomonadota bacterium]